jgi:hypothetical protein
MNFINDRITDEDRKRFDFTVFKTPIYSALPYYSEERLKLQKSISQPRCWTVDREAKCFIIDIGTPRRGMPDPDDPDDVYFSLWWKETNIEFGATRVWHAGDSLTWQHVWTDIPEQFKDRKIEIHTAIEVALTTHQRDGDYAHHLWGSPIRRRLDEIKVEFAKPYSDSE